MKQLTIATLLLIAVCITFSTVSNQINVLTTKDQQIKILKEMLKESNDREREYIKALGVTLEDVEKEIEQNEQTYNVLQRSLQDRQKRI